MLHVPRVRDTSFGQVSGRYDTPSTVFVYQHDLVVQRSSALPMSSIGERITRFLLLIILEARAVIILVYVLRSLAGAFLTPWTPSVVTVIQLLGAIATMILSVTVVYLLNGLSDITEDRVNGSKRPLASGEISPRQVTYSIVVIIGVLMALSPSLPLIVSICNFLMITLGFVYSMGPLPAKMHSAAGLTVAGAGAMLPYVSSSAAVSGHVSLQAILTALLLGAWVWAGGSAKDLSDVAGDAAAGRRTLAVRLGTRRASGIIAGRVAVVSLIGTALATMQLAPPALFFGPFCAALLVSVVATSRSQRDLRTRRQERKLYRVFMSTQFILNGALIVAPALL